MKRAWRMRGMGAALGGRLRDERGQTAVETAISVSVLLAMMIGFIEICFAYYDYNFVNDAAREASRYAMVRGSSSCTNTPSLTNCSATASEIQTWVQGLGYPGIKSSSLTATTTWCAASGSTPATWAACSGATANTPGNLVKVVVSYPVAFQIPWSSHLSFNVSSTSQMVISQ